MKLEDEIIYNEAIYDLNFIKRCFINIAKLNPSCYRMLFENLNNIYMISNNEVKVK